MGQDRQMDAHKFASISRTAKMVLGCWLPWQNDSTNVVQLSDTKSINETAILSVLLPLQTYLTNYNYNQFVNNKYLMAETKTDLAKQTQ